MLDKYTHSNIVYYKHNGDDEPYDNAHISYKSVKMLKSFKIIIVDPTLFVLHKSSSGSSQPVLCQSYKVNIEYKNRYLKLSVHSAQCMIHTHNRTEQNMQPQ